MEPVVRLVAGRRRADQRIVQLGSGVVHLPGETANPAPAALATLCEHACRASLRVVDLSDQRSGSDACPLFFGMAKGAVPALCSLMQRDDNQLKALRLGGNGLWTTRQLALLIAALQSER